MMGTLDQAAKLEQRILILAPTATDANLSREILTEAGFLASACDDIESLCDEAEKGCAALLVTEESLTPEGIACLHALVEGQPPWSDLPVLAMTTGGQESQAGIHALDVLGNVYLLERPVHVATLVSAARTALRARKRQYQLRSHLEKRSRAEENTRFFAEASRRLSYSLDYGVTLQSVAELLVPRYADWCAIDVETQSGELDLVGITHSDPEKVDLARELREKYGLRSQDGNVLYQVLRNGRPLIISGITEDALRNAAQNEEHLNILRKLEMKSAVIVPLRLGEETIGTLTLVSDKPGRSYSESDLPVLEEIAYRCAIAVQNSRLYWNAQKELREREVIERALRASEERYRESIEALIDPFGVYTAVRDTNGKIVDFNIEYINEAATLSNKLSRDKQIGKRLLSVLPGHVSSGLFEEYCHVVETGEPLVKEMHAYQDDTRDWVSTYDIRAAKVGDGFVASWRDVSGLKQSEQALRDLNFKLEQRLAELDAVIQSIPDAILIGNEQGITACNTKALELLGFDDLNQLNHNISELVGIIQPRDVETEKVVPLQDQPFIKALQGEASTLEMVIRHQRLNTERVIRCAAAPVLQGGRVSGMVCISTDITERQAEEELLRRNQERLNASLEASLTGTFHWNMLTGKVEFDENLNALFGLEANDSISCIDDFIECVHPDDREALREELRSCEEDYSDFDMEYRVIWPDGSIHWIADKGRIFFGDAGTPAYMAGACVDITERKEAEQVLMHEHALVELERGRLRAVLDVLPMGVFIANADGRIEEMNPIARVIWGGNTPLSDTPETYGDDYPAWWPETGERITSDEYGMTRALRGEVVTAEEMEIETYVGQRKTILNYAIPIRNNAHQIIGAVAVNVDITERKHEEVERKKLEAQFQHAQKMESLGVLAGGVAHDFNNLLVGILGNAGLGLAETAASSTVHEYLRGIENASRRAADLCRQMLAYAGKGKFFVERVNVDYLVKEMTTLLHATISKKAELNFDFGDNLPLIEADATQLRQVIMNLITNASEAVGDKGGLITVSTGTMYCDREFLSQTLIDEYIPEGTYVYVRISDNGAGMDKETAARIFDPFFTTKFTGRGLGLAAVLGIVRSHRGAMHVYSEEGRGSVFTIFLPASKEQASTIDAPQDSAETSTILTTGTVLLVDDSDTVRAVATRMLENAGFTVLPAEDGVEGVELFKRHHTKIDCVLLDLTMPRMDGREAFEHMSKIDPNARIILSTGYNQQESLSLFENAKLSGFIQKPYQARQLVQRISSVIAAKED